MRAATLPSMLGLAALVLAGCGEHRAPADHQTSGSSGDRSDIAVQAPPVQTAPAMTVTPPPVEDDDEMARQPPPVARPAPPPDR